jgi:hypothetical protein
MYKWKAIEPKSMISISIVTHFTTDQTLSIPGHGSAILHGLSNPSDTDCVVITA